MRSEVGQLLLSQDTTVTCPKCANEFSLDKGFARKALQHLADASTEAIGAMRKAERSEVQKIARQMANEQARSAQSEAEGLKKLLKTSCRGIGWLRLTT
jgi:hypothetical protein